MTDGWDNVTYRLGDDLAVRLPRRAVAAELFESEQRWLPVLARRVDVAVPEPVRAGHPGEGYPWPWSVVRWIDGTPVDEAPLDPTEAAPFGRFLADLHGPAPDDAPRNPYRGIPLRAKGESLAIRWDRLDAPRRRPGGPGRCRAGGVGRGGRHDRRPPGGLDPQ